MQNNEVRLKKLLESMTLKEKISQMLQIAPNFYLRQGAITGPMEELELTEDIIYNAGSVLGAAGAELTMDIQRKYLENNRHKIPLIFMADVIHGFRTIFPIPLAMACSWNPELVEESARVAAKEASIAGIHVTFSPMVDLVRDPRWGRVMESTGEDPWLNSLFARAFVRGYQGKGLSDKESVASCVKHFAAYGAVEAGRDYNTVDMSERTLREYYLPAYKAAVDEGCAMVMTAFTTVDSIPSTVNQWLLRDLLRGEWGFDGVIISDWGAVKETIAHGVAADGQEAAEKAIKAGVDIEMMSSEYVHHLESLVQKGIVDEALIDEAVMRILKLKEQLGLFENPYRGADPEREKTVLLCDEHRKLARKIAAQSMVLLKNQGVLPFDKNIGKVAIIGPYAEANHILGGWSCEGRNEEAVTLKQGIVAKIGQDNVIVAEGCDVMGEQLNLSSAIAAAQQADAIILALGEHPDMSGEAGSRAFITLPGKQLVLARAVLELGKPTVVVLFNGRPLEITELDYIAPAILEAWFPGTEGGNAIADILFGDVNPSGRLTMSFPYTVGQIPVYYNCYNTGRPKGRENNEFRFCSKYLDIPNAPLYPFGYGLSYTTFQYSDFVLDSNKLTVDGAITASVTVTNTGKRAGEEVVQLYIRDVSASVVRPVKELKGFQKIYLEPGESRKVNFIITEPMLRFHRKDFSFKSEPGHFIAFVGPNSAQLLEQPFELV
ncbi:beta-glucosidase BglX [Caldicoprobacter algeriensis]|uniref:beta-glucosidase BglX n=1 Tax=Caldicoprobacter algeriensis TaxID=699281 RepID=UPI00207952D5|nr:beta-glucosidase BglX [Caldicoprobacter algeriensis]MCM8899894.1 beta-glucosidase BglX [Caldicoprobacter algeriensis]